MEEREVGIKVQILYVYAANELTIERERKLTSSGARAFKIILIKKSGITARKTLWKHGSNVCKIRCETKPACVCKET